MKQCQVPKAFDLPVKQEVTGRWRTWRNSHLTFTVIVNSVPDDSSDKKSDLILAGLYDLRPGHGPTPQILASQKFGANVPLLCLSSFVQIDILLSWFRCDA